MKMNRGFCIAVMLLNVAGVTGSRAVAQSVTQAPHAQASALPLSGRGAGNSNVQAVEAPIAGTTASVMTMNPSVQVQGQYTGSAGASGAFAGKLSLKDAIQRGLRYNLGAVGQSLMLRQAQGQSEQARSALLPNVSGYLAESLQQVNLRAEGMRINVPGFNFPTKVGPFNNIDLRGNVTQSVMDWTAWNNYRASKDAVHAAREQARDARELVVLAVCGEYLQVAATEERVKSAHAQLETAQALLEQTRQKRGVGLVAQVDVDRSEVEELAQQQRVTSLEDEVAKQKIALARMTGLPVTDAYELSDAVPFTAAPALTLEDALTQATAQRADIRAAEAQVRAAERAVAAAHGERLPALAVGGNYGSIGENPNQARVTFAAQATLSIPIWQGGKTEGDVAAAQAALAQRRAELEDLRGQVEGEVRGAYLDLHAATSQVSVAQRNLQVSRETLDLTRQRFDAGVTDNVEVVQAQESLTAAELDVINSVFAHNLAKLSLARSVASAEANLPQFLSLQ